MARTNPADFLSLAPPWVPAHMVPFQNRLFVSYIPSAFSLLNNISLQERDAMIQEEIARLEKLQKLAEKIHQEAKMTDTKLDDIEAWIEDEAKRIDQLHPKDAKNNCDQIERELARTEEVIKSMFSDVQILRDNRFSQAQDLHRR